MIEELKKALADYEEFLGFTDQGDTIKVEITKFIGVRAVFDAINSILLTKYDAKYTPFDKTKKLNAYYILPKGRFSKPVLIDEVPLVIRVADGIDTTIKQLQAMSKDLREVAGK